MYTYIKLPLRKNEMSLMTPVDLIYEISLFYLFPVISLSYLLMTIYNLEDAVLLMTHINIVFDL